MRCAYLPRAMAQSLWNVFAGAEATHRVATCRQQHEEAVRSHRDEVSRCLSTIDHLNEQEKQLIQNLVRLRGSCIPCALECHKGEHRL